LRPVSHLDRFPQNFLSTLSCTLADEGPNIWYPSPQTLTHTARQNKALNKLPSSFLKVAIGTFIGNTVHPTSFEKDGEGWHVFSFESQRAT
jgi:hypothetical protein